MKVEDLYPKSLLPFDELLEEAEDQCSGEVPTEFVKKMRENYRKWGGGMYLSDPQHAWLKRIAFGS